MGAIKRWIVISIKGAYKMKKNNVKTKMMKKKILGLALIAMSVVTFTGMAQTTNKDNNVKKENIKGKKADKQMRRNQVNPFEGLNLTDAQKTQLQNLDTQCKAARDQQMKARKENKQRNDSTRMAERRAAKKSYLDQVKAIVGPEQYVVFLENFYVNGGNRGNKALKPGKRHDKHGFAHGHGNKHDRKDGKNRQQNCPVASQS